VGIGIGAGLLAVASLALGAVAPGAQAVEPSVATPVAPPVAAPAALVPPPGAATPKPSDLPTRPAVPVPENDNFESATAISGYTGTVSGSNIGASFESELSEPPLNGGMGKTVWYVWTAPATAIVEFDLCAGSAFDSLIGAYIGTAVYDLTFIAGNDDGCPGSSSSLVEFQALGGTTYHIQIDSYVESTDGTFNLHWAMAQPAFSLSVADMSMPEGDDETTYFDFTITLSEAVSQDVSVNWATSDGTALEPEDYAASTGTAIIAEGNLTTTFAVDVNGDFDNETDETFNVSLSEPDGAVLADATAIGTIENDDLAADLYMYYDTFGAKPKAGGWINYIAQVYNSAGSDSASVVVTLQPPEGATFDSAYSSQGTCAPGVPVVCSFGVMEAGQSAYAVMYVSPSRTGTYRSSATVSSDLPDPDESDNTASLRTKVAPNKDGCTIVGTNEPDVIVGTKGDDFICAYGGDDSVNGRDGNDTVWAGPGDDTVLGAPGFDTLLGNSGEDIITGGSGSDQIDGGGGIDTVSYATSPAGATVDLPAGTAVDGFPPVVAPGSAEGPPPGETVTSINTVIGSAFDDTLIGKNEQDWLYGEAGDDDLSGNGGADTLDGGDGIDTLDGGGGSDTCTGETETHCES